MGGDKTTEEMEQEQKQKTKNVVDTSQTQSTNATGSSDTVANQNSQTTGQVNQAGTTTNNQVSNPWEPSVPILTGILGEAGNLVQGAGPTGLETNALDGIEATASNINQNYNPQVEQLAQDQFNGGGFGAGDADVIDAYGLAKTNLEGIANGENLDLANNQWLQSMLAGLTDDTTNTVGGIFANAGRSFSGAHAGTLGREITKGTAPLLFDQYNRERGYQTSAIDQLMGGANNKAGILNNSAGLKLDARGKATDTLGMLYDPFNKVLAAEDYRAGLPVDRLKQVSDLVLPIAGAGGSQSAVGTSQNQQNSQENTVGQSTQSTDTVANSLSNLDSKVKSKGTTTGTTTGTSTTTAESDPLKLALGTALGVGGMLLSPVPKGGSTVGGMLF